MTAPIVYDMKYGTLTVGPVKGAWREDTYTPNDGRKPMIEWSMCEGQNDTSPRQNHSTYGEGHGYNPRCSCCWLNITHTEARHRRELP